MAARSVGIFIWSLFEVINQTKKTLLCTGSLGTDAIKCVGLTAKSLPECSLSPFLSGLSLLSP